MGDSALPIGSCSQPLTADSMRASTVEQAGDVCAVVRMIACRDFRDASHLEVRRTQELVLLSGVSTARTRCCIGVCTSAVMSFRTVAR